MELSKGRRIATFLIISIITGAVYYTPYLKNTFYDQMMAVLDVSDVQLANLSLAYGLANLIWYVPSGFLADRIDPKKLMLITNAGMLVCTIWYAMLPGYTALLIIHVMFGMFSIGTFWCARLKMLRNLASEDDQGKIFGIAETLRAVAQALIAVACMAAIATTTLAGAGFRTVLIINAITYVILLIASWIFMPSEEQKDEKKMSVSEVLGDYAKLLKNKNLWLVIVLLFCGYTIWIVVGNYLGTYCTRVLGLSENMSSTLSIFRNYIIVFASGLMGIVLDKFRRKGSGFMLFYGASFICFVLIWMTEASLWPCVILTLIAGFLVNSVVATYWSALGPAGIKEDDTGMATGLISVFALSPDFIAPTLSAHMIEAGEQAGDIASGFHMILVYLMICSGIGVIAAYLLKRCQIKLEAQGVKLED